VKTPSARWPRHSRASSSRCRPTWTPDTATTSPTCGSARAASGAVFPPAPRLDPVRFAVARNALGERHKQFERGLRQLDGEGLIQVLRRDPDHPESILAGLGELQFEAVAERMRVEFGVELRLEPLPFKLARRADRELAAAIRAWPSGEALFRSQGEEISIACLTCGHRWQRNPDDCPQCGKSNLLPVRKPLFEKARGTQQSIIGYRIAKECSSCDWVSE
jgi:hypothetical protein